MATEIGVKQEAIPAQIEVIKDIKEPKKVVFDNKVLMAICSCESDIFGKGEPQHYELDGITVIRGRVDKRDTGLCQINRGFHLAAAKALGLDIDTPQGNWDYAKHLYQTQGTRPWEASRSCWSKKL